MKKIFLLVWATFFFTVVGNLLAGALKQKAQPSYAPNEILVQLKTGLSDSAKKNIFDQIGEARPLLMKESFLIKINNGMTVEEAIGAMKKNPLIINAQPNFFIHSPRSLRPTKSNVLKSKNTVVKNASKFIEPTLTETIPGKE